MKTPALTFFLAASLPFAVCSASANDWPSWRGPSGDGKLPAEASYPVSWSEEENRLWRVEAPGPGNSSPVVAGSRLFLTLAQNEGRMRSLLCYDTNDGSLLWRRTVEHDAPETVHRTNDHCAASPLVHEGVVYAWHGNAGLHAYDLEGNTLWSRDLGSDYEHIWGPNAASPVPWRGALFIHAGPGPVTRLFAVNRESGEILWQRELAEEASENAEQFKGSWATPLLVERDGLGELLLGLPDHLKSFDPATGEERWSVVGLGDLSYSNVLVGGDKAVYLCGFGGPGIGIRLPAPGQSGDLTDEVRLWADPPKGQNQNPQRIGSGQIVGDYLYLLNEPGVVQCLRVDSGESVWRERLSEKSWSSMNLVGGKLYVNEKNGSTYVIDPDPSGLKLVSTNSLAPNQHTNASLAFAGGRVYQRTDQYLYAFGE